MKPSRRNSIAAICNMLDAPVDPIRFLALESAASTLAPERKGLFSGFGLECEHEFEEAAVERRAIIVREFDKTGFLNEATELDQMSGAFAPLHGPIAHVMSGALRLQTMVERHRPPERS